MNYLDYKDIINLPNHKSKTRPHMSLHDRAAQFAPFAALSGHADAVKEKARITTEKIELAEDMKIHLSRKLETIKMNLTENPQVSITYFRPDATKSGGAYFTKTETVKKVEQNEHLIIMGDETIIPIDDILAIEVFNQR